MKKTQKIMVTGSEGTIGKIVVDELRKQGHEVVTIDIAGRHPVDITRDPINDLFADQTIQFDTPKQIEKKLFDIDVLDDIRSELHMMLCNMEALLEIMYSLSEPSALGASFTVTFKNVSVKRVKELGIILQKALSDKFGANQGISRDDKIIKIHMREEYQRRLRVKEKIVV